MATQSSLPSFPFVKTSRHTRTLHAPNSTTPLLTMNYPMSLSASQSITVTHPASGRTLATIKAHSFWTTKVDVSLHGHSYHFKKRFSSQTGLGEVTWSKGSGKSELALAGKDGVIAKFVPRKGKVKSSEERVDGAFEICRAGGLEEKQLEEVVVTAVAEIARMKRKGEGWVGALDVLGAAG